MKKVNINQLINAINLASKSAPDGEFKNSLLSVKRGLKKISKEGYTVIDKKTVKKKKEIKDFLTQLTKIAGVSISLALWKDFWEHILK